MRRISLVPSIPSRASTASTFEDEWSDFDLQEEVAEGSSTACSSRAWLKTASPRTQMRRAALRNCPGVTCDFQAQALMPPVLGPEWSDARCLVAFMLRSKWFELLLAVILLFNISLVVVDTDQRAACRMADAQADCPTASWLRYLNYLLLAFYCTELGARVFVRRLAFFGHRWNILDLSIVLVGILAEALEDTAVPVSILRVCRILRLFRVLRFVHQFRELYMMLHGLLSTLKTICWAAVLMLGLLTLWSVLAVEFLHPIVQRMHRDNLWTECSRCPAALESVMKANLTFFETIVVGDNWGDLAVPLIKEHWVTAAVFLGVTFTCSIGLTNLIFAVIIDQAAEAREEDLKHQVAMKLQKQERARRRFMQICSQLDTDGDGSVSRQELIDGFEKTPEFQRVCQLLDVDREDLDCIYQIMDLDKSGDVSYQEFASILTHLKAQDTRTMLMFIKFYVHEIWSKVDEQLTVTKDEILEKVSFTAKQLEDTSAQSRVRSRRRLQRRGVNSRSPKCTAPQDRRMKKPIPDSLILAQATVSDTAAVVATGTAGTTSLHSGDSFALVRGLHPQDMCSASSSLIGAKRQGVRLRTSRIRSFLPPGCCEQSSVAETDSLAFSDGMGPPMCSGAAPEIPVVHDGQSPVGRAQAEGEGTDSPMPDSSPSSCGRARSRRARLARPDRVDDSGSASSCDAFRVRPASEGEPHGVGALGPALAPDRASAGPAESQRPRAVGTPQARYAPGVLAQPSGFPVAASAPCAPSVRRVQRGRSSAAVAPAPAEAAAGVKPPRARGDAGGPPAEAAPGSSELRGLCPVKRRSLDEHLARLASEGRLADRRCHQGRGVAFASCPGGVRKSSSLGDLRVKHAFGSARSGVVEGSEPQSARQGSPPHPRHCRTASPQRAFQRVTWRLDPPQDERARSLSSAAIRQSLRRVFTPNWLSLDTSAMRDAAGAAMAAATSIIPSPEELVQRSRRGALTDSWQCQTASRRSRGLAIS